MKNYFVIAVFIVLCFACKFGSAENTKTSNVAPAKNSNNRTVTEVTNSNVVAKSENALVSLKNMKGKTASQIKLFGNKEVNGRLEKLMGADYKPMKNVWNVETPMEVEGNVLQLTGCEQHNCGDNQYIMFLDTANDNINVFHIVEGKLKPYKEKGEIKLPKKLAEEFELTKSSLEVK